MNSIFLSSMLVKNVLGKVNAVSEINRLFYSCYQAYYYPMTCNDFNSFAALVNVPAKINKLNLFHKVVLRKNCVQSVFCIHTDTTVSKSRKTKEMKKPKNIIMFKPKSKYPVVDLWLGITVAELAEVTGRPIAHVFEAMSYIEEYAHIHNPKFEIHNKVTLFELAKSLGYRVFLTKKPSEKQEEKAKESKDLKKAPAPRPEDLIKRPPVVTIMGHVDHGKTTLLDSYRHSSIVSQEHGGITQHIGAFSVKFPAGQITFLDTPGHAAFKAMRARGAHVTDIVILVVAADDGIMEQTIESIKFAKEANVPIIVAINKIDKLDKMENNVDAVKRELLGCGIQLEEFGGDVQAICISALKKINLDQLTEAILTQAEIMEIAADPKGKVEGVILEAKADKTKGKISTTLVKRGTVKKGIFLVSGTSWVKIRTMFDEYGKAISEVPPGIPVQIAGWKSLPVAGDEVLQADSEKHAKEVIEYREKLKEEDKLKVESIVIEEKMKQHYEKYRREREERLARGRYRKERSYFKEKEYVFDTMPNLSFVLKGDVRGSVEAILDIVNTYQSHDACRLDLIHSAVGDVTENDVMLAESFEGVIYCFNVKIPLLVKQYAEERNVAIKTFNVIYHLIDDMKKEISDRLPMVVEEDILGEAAVLQEFEIKDGKKKVPVAGCRCTKGLLKRGSFCKVIRSGTVIYNGPVISLRHEKNDVETIKKDVECGLRIEDPEVRFEVGDTIICFNPKNVSQVTDWNPGF